MLGLDEQEVLDKETFLQARSEIDKSLIERVLTAVGTLSTEYFESGEHHSNWYAFMEDGKRGYAFFAVYSIGGMINKEGERPDIDLLVATNMRWSSGPNSMRLSREYLLGKLVEEFGEEYSISINGMPLKDYDDTDDFDEIPDLPDNYNVGETKGKVVLTLTPLEGGKSIDISYVRSFRNHGGEESHSFVTEEEFIAKDIDPTNGEQLSRLILYRAKVTDIREPTFRW